MRTKIDLFIFSIVTKLYPHIERLREKLREIRDIIKRVTKNNMKQILSPRYFPVAFTLIFIALCISFLFFLFSILHKLDIIDARTSQTLSILQDLHIEEIQYEN